MANNDLLRPPTLNFNQNAPNEANAQNAGALNLQMVELRQVVETMVQSALNSHFDHLSSTSNRQATAVDSVDQIIEDRYRENINEIDRIPDVVRCLRDFSGNPCEFSSWKKSVERVLQIYESTRGTPRYYGILSVIRNKITGEADVVLESYSTPLNWNAIAKCLTLHYADKRDVSTLEFELMSLRQENNSVEEYYKRIYNHLSLILNKVSCMEINPNSIVLLTKTYRDKALDTFVRGLNGDLPRLLAISEPTDLPLALQLCQKLENQTFMNAHVNNVYKVPVQTQRKFITTVGNQRHPQQSRSANQTFFPQLAHLPQYHAPNPLHYAPNPQHYAPNPQYYAQQHNMPHFQNAPQWPSAPKPMSSEPMDVDPSLQSRRTNYMNRPNNQNNFQANKRPASSFANRQKRQRNFNIVNQVKQQSFENTVDRNEAQEADEQEYCTAEQDFTDIHFLG